MQMGGQQSTSTERHTPTIKSQSSSVNRVKKHARVLPDGAYVLMVDKQGNPEEPVSIPYHSSSPDYQFYLKYSGLLDDIKNNLKYRFILGSDVTLKKEAEEKIKRLQILLALLVVAVLYLVVTRR